MPNPEQDRRKPLVSQETIDEAAAMEARDREAGGFPWDVPEHPDNFQPGGWHHGQIFGTDARSDAGGDDR